jgi:hypothetical protein
MDEIARRKAASGGELDEEEDSEEKVTALMRKRMAMEESKEGKEDDAVSVDSTGNKPATAQPGPRKQQGGHQHRVRLPPRKKLSCVLFADNTHVLLTGDASGNVDVYRLVGMGHGSDDALGGSGGTAAAAVGSEEHEAQLEALRTVLHSIQ